MLSQEEARNIITTLKKDYGITYTAIAQNTGISVSLLSLFLDKKRNIKRDKIFKLENYIKSLKGAENYEIQ